MPLVEWTEKMSVNVGVLDEDHKKLFALVNELFERIQKGDRKNLLEEVLDDLIAYTIGHFNREEKFFVETDYPDTAIHKAMHVSLTKQVIEIQRKFKAGETSLLDIELLQFLSAWLVQHIQGADKKYSAYLNSQGIE